MAFKSLKPLHRAPLLHVSVQESLRATSTRMAWKPGRRCRPKANSPAARRQPQLGARRHQGAGVGRRSGDRAAASACSSRRSPSSRCSTISPMASAARCARSRKCARSAGPRSRPDRQDARDDHRRGYPRAAAGRRHACATTPSATKLRRGGRAVSTGCCSAARTTGCWCG